MVGEEHREEGALRIEPVPLAAATREAAAER